MEDTLLIFDHIDEIWKKHGPQFRWWVIDIADRFKATILLISKMKVEDDLQESNVVKVKSIELQPLNEYESADLLIAYTKRVLTLDELHCGMTSMSLHEALEVELNLKNCQGIPQYIVILSELLEYNTFDTINIKRELPNWIRKKIRKNQTSTQPNDLNQHLINSGNSENVQRYNLASTQQPLSKFGNNQKRESKNQKKKRERKEKKKEAKLERRLKNSPFISKNGKKKLRKIYEEEELDRFQKDREDKYFQEESKYSSDGMGRLLF